MLAGCASQRDNDDAADVTARFLDAVQSDPDAACTLLTPRTRSDLRTEDGGSCAEALPTDRLRQGAVRRADTWADKAKVDTDAGTVFLVRFNSGWLVAAAGCAPKHDAPYDCVVG